MHQQYTITIRGALTERWSAWLGSVESVDRREQDRTVLTVDVTDQTTLHGVLNRIRNLGLHLVSGQQGEDTQ